MSQRDANGLFSADRPADPRIFGWGEVEGVQGPAAIAEGWLLDSHPASFCVLGAGRQGKTSFLNKLEHLLTAKAAPSRSLWHVLPLYVDCIGCDSLRTFYRRILDRACERFSTAGPSPGEGEALEISLEGCCLLQRGGKAPAGPEILELFSKDLELLLGQMRGPRRRLVLLIDNAQAATGQAWEAQLFAHLRALVESFSAPSPDGAEDVSLALALSGNGELEGSLPSARRLMSLLDRVPLSTLSRDSLRSLIRQAEMVPLDEGWTEKIFRASAGHPWIVQDLLRHFSETCGGDLDAFGRTYESTYELFAKPPEREGVFEGWLGALGSRDLDLLTHLALAADGLSAQQLAADAKTPRRTVQRSLRALQASGLVYRFTPPGVGNGRRSQYSVAGAFRAWLLRRPLLRVAVRRLQSGDDGRSGFIGSSGGPLRRRRDGGNPSPPSSPGKGEAVSPGGSEETFRLLLSRDYKLVLAEGRRTELSSLDPHRFDAFERIRQRTSDIGSSEEKLKLIAGDLGDSSRGEGWAQAWKSSRGSQSGGDNPPTFILAADDPGLWELPFEMLLDGGEYLGLQVPVYRELIGEWDGPSYRRSGPAFPPGERADVLLVAAARGGDYDGRRYEALPRAEEELGDAAGMLATAQGSGAMQIGRVVVLGDEERLGPKLAGLDQVELQPLGRDRLRRGLEGELGGPFQLVLCAGHYVYGKDDNFCGLLLPAEEGALELFSLVELSQAVQPRPPRLLYLSACGSALLSHRQGDRYLGPAYSCLRAGVGAVVGMRWEVDDGEARELSKAFLFHLLDCGVPERALWQARREFESNGPGRTAWAAAAMFAR